MKDSSLTERCESWRDKCQIVTSSVSSPQLSFYLAAVIFKLFGTSLGSLRILGLSLHVLIPLLIYLISRNFMNHVLSIAAALPAAIIGMPYFGFVPLAVWQGIAASV